MYPVCLLKPPFFVSSQIQDRRLRVVFFVALAREVRPPRLRAAACSSNMQVKSEVALMPLGQTAEPEESRVTALVAMPFSLLVTRVSRLLMRVEERPSSVMTPESYVAPLLLLIPCPILCYVLSYMTNMPDPTLTAFKAEIDNKGLMAVLTECFELCGRIFLPSLPRTPWILMAIKLFAPNQLPSRCLGRLISVQRRFRRLGPYVGQVPRGWGGSLGPSGLHGGDKAAKASES